MSGRRVTYKERLRISPELRNIDEWPPYRFVPTKSETHRTGLIRNWNMVSEVLKGARLGKTADKYDVAPSQLNSILNRCLGGSLDDPPALTQGLVPYARINQSQRRAPLSRMDKTRGSHGEFLKLLATYPDLKRFLDDLIDDWIKERPYALNLKPGWIHDDFKHALKKLDLPTDQYPYTTLKVGYHGLRNYFRSEVVRKQHEIEERRNRKSAMWGKAIPDRILREIQIDEQIIDCETKELFFQGGRSRPPVRIARCTILLAIDVASDTYLGFHVAYTDSPNQDDFLALIDNMIAPWKPVDLTMPGLAYQPGSGFPSMLLPDDKLIGLGKVCWDNAWAHTSHAVRDVLCNQLGATINRSKPASPTARNLVEYAFKRVNELTHRVNSTTGSNLLDPHKEPKKNRRKAPLLLTQHLEELLSVTFADHNVTPQRRFDSASPFDVFRYQLEQNFVRLLPRWSKDSWRPFELTQRCFLHSDATRHYVNALADTYYADGFGWEEHKEVIIVGDRRDNRLIIAYSLQGQYLGPLSLSSEKLKYPMRPSDAAYFAKLTASQRAARLNPTTPALDQLRNHAKRPKAAQKRAQLEREVARNTRIELYPGLEQDSSRHDDQKKAEPKVEYVWKPNQEIN